MQFIFEFGSGNVKVEAENERAATVAAPVMAKIHRGEMVLNVQRNPRGRHDSIVMACGCKRYIERVRNKLTTTVDRSSERVCSGCGAEN